MSECNVNQLSSDAACFTCLDPKTRDGIQTELLCQILHAIGGGGGGTSDVNIVSSITLQVEAIDFDIRDLDFLTDSVDVTGSTVIATGSLGRTWTLDFATDQVDASGSLVGAVQSGAWSVSVSNFPASFSVTQGTSPWVVSLTSTTITGTVSVTQSGVWSTGRTWDLGFATDQVDATGSSVKIYDGTDTAEVNIRTDGIPSLEVSDDMTSMETFRFTMTASSDTTITFSQAVRLVRIKNESLTATIFVRDGAISSNTPINAEILGVSPLANLPTTEYYPFKTTTIHVRSAGTPIVDITGFY